MDEATKTKVLLEFTKRIGTNFKQGETVCKEIAMDFQLDPEEVTDLVYGIWDIGYTLDVEEEEKTEEKIEDKGEE